jgi:hypothetical protein
MFQESKRLRKPNVQKWQDEVYEEVGASVSSRHALNLTTQDTASLWLLCKQVNTRCLHPQFGLQHVFWKIGNVAGDGKILFELLNLLVCSGPSSAATSGALQNTFYYVVR